MGQKPEDPVSRYSGKGMNGLKARTRAVKVYASPASTVRELRGSRGGAGGRT